MTLTTTGFMVQGQWLVLCGVTAGGQMLDCLLHTFDFASLSWSIATLVGKPLAWREVYLAACHEGSLVVMGGQLSQSFTHVRFSQ